MSTDIAVFLQSTDKVKAFLADEASHQNQWRIFSKLGDGFSNSRYRGEIVNNAYSCLPKYNSEGQAVGGYEFTITVRGSVPDDSSLTKVETKVMNAFNGAMNFLFDNFQA
jgi:hypothetical protein